MKYSLIRASPQYPETPCQRLRRQVGCYGRELGVKPDDNLDRTAVDASAIWPSSSIGMTQQMGPCELICTKFFRKDGDYKSSPKHRRKSDIEEDDSVYQVDRDGERCPPTPTPTPEEVLQRLDIVENFVVASDDHEFVGPVRRLGRSSSSPCTAMYLLRHRHNRRLEGLRVAEDEIALGVDINSFVGVTVKDSLLSSNKILSTAIPSTFHTGRAILRRLPLLWIQSIYWRAEHSVSVCYCLYSFSSPTVTYCNH